MELGSPHVAKAELSQSILLASTAFCLRVMRVSPPTTICQSPATEVHGSKAVIDLSISRAAEARQLLLPSVDPRRFALEGVGEAYSLIKEGQAHGKLSIDI